MMKITRLLALAAALVVIAIAASQFLSFSGLKRFVRLFQTTPSLAAYGVDIQQTSVSGVSSGGAMALQMHVAHASIMRGAGVIAGVAYECTDSRLPVGDRLKRGLDCMEAEGSFGGTAAANFSMGRTTAAAAVPGAIDDPAVHLPRQKVWLFSGYNDGLVRRAAMDGVAKYYENYVNAGNIFYKNNNHAPHALVTDNYGGTCLSFNSAFINNCNYDTAGRLLQHIYGHLNQRSSSGLSGSIAEFDQREFVSGQTPASVGLADTGYVYVPGTCGTQACRVHVVFHGCQQYAGLVGGAVYRHAGYNEWADRNNIIVLYPQTEENLTFNPKGCWDWWGLEQSLSRNGDFARKTGYQISAVKAMLDRLAQNFVPVAGSDTFGTPQDFYGPDSTARSVALVWRPNKAAAGFNVYRSSSSGGPFTKLNSNPVTGASFGDGELTPDTTYHYRLRAVDPNGVESPPTNTVTVATTHEPPACDPYFSNNVMHEFRLRAYGYLYLWTRAVGSNDDLGLNTLTTFSQLMKQGPFMYRQGYCP
jgi:poly(3-hydroxybutyrate) depolymerase